MDKGLICIIIGLVCSITMIGVIIGIPLIILGTYWLTQKNKQEEKNIDKNIQIKQEQLNNIDTTLQEKEKQAQKDIENKIQTQKTQLVELKNNYEQLKQEQEQQFNQELKTKQEQLDNINNTYEEKEKEMNKELNEKYHRLNNQITDKEKTLESLKRQIKKTEKDLIKIKDDIELQSYGLYEPQYKFINSTQYKEELDKIRQQQKGMIKNKNAATCRTEWQIDGSKSKGKAFSNQQIKQIIRSFNTECDAIISKVTYSNIENSKKRIEKSYQQLNKMNERNTISISYRYKELKLDELQLAFEYEQKKQEEKEMLREAREREREEKKLQKELDKEKNKYNRENDKLKTEIEKATDELKKANEKEKAKLEAEIAKLKQTLEDNEKQIENIDLRKTKTGAGYVYIISNRGSFGEDVFKIGVTRRDNPDERVRELSSASVPFRYDSHAYIFSKDAYKLESELHNRFDKNRVNKVNRRKEFFNISIDDVRKIVDENKANVDVFIENPSNDEYEDTLRINDKLKEQEGVI